MKQLPLHIRMWLAFLALRKRPFTEKDMSSEELQELVHYIKGNYSKNMYLSFGKIHMEGKIAKDFYDFAKAEPTSFLNHLINFSCKYHDMGYKGYEVRIDLTDYV